MSSTEILNDYHSALISTDLPFQHQFELRWDFGKGVVADDQLLLMLPAHLTCFNLHSWELNNQQGYKIFYYYHICQLFHWNLLISS